MAALTGPATINVLPAVYDESVTLGADVILQGAPASDDRPAVGPLPHEMEGCLSWSGLIRGKISLSGDNVAVRGLTLMPPIPSSAVIGVAAAADGLTIECNLIDAANTGSLSWGVETMSSAPVGDTKLRILSNTFRDIYGGVYLNSGAPSTTIHGNVFDRMILGGVSSDSDGSVVITHNVFRDGEDGVWIGHYHPDTVVRGNSFSGFRDEALDYDPAEPALNARQNWWGAASGPRTQALEHGEITPDQVVDGNIDVDPWCRAEGCATAPVAVSGVVTDGENPVPGAVVEAVWPDGTAESAATAADGVYRLNADIPWSVNELAVQARLGDRSSLPVSLSVQNEARHESVNFTLTERDESDTDPAQSTISSDRAEAAAGGAPPVITVVAHNADGRRRTVGGDTVAIYTDFGDLSDVLDNGDGTYTAQLSSQDVGEATLHGEINGTFLSSPASVKFVVGPPSAATTTITAEPAEIPADGASQSVITVDLKAAGGSDIDTNGDEVVTLALTEGSRGTLTPAVEGTDGTWTAVLTSSTQAGTSTIIGTLDNGDGEGAQPLNSVAIVTHTPLAGDVARSTMTATPSASVAADDVTTSSVVVQVKDVHQNDRTTAGDTVDFKTTKGTFQNGLNTITVLSDANGRATALLKSAVTGAAEVTAKLNSVDMVAKSTVNFTTPPGTFSPYNSTLTGPAPPNRPANGTAKARMTVQAKKSDNGTHSVAGLTVELRAKAPDATLTGDFLDAVTGTSLGNPVVLTTNASGQASVDLVSTTVGTATVTGSIDGGVIGNNGAVAPVVNFQALSDPSRTTITASTLDANVGSTATVTLTARDGAGAQRGFGGEAVALGLAPGSVGSLTPVPVTDNGNGTYTATLSSADAGEATITGTIGGQPVTTASPVVRFHATLSGALSTIKSDEPAVVFGGQRKAVVTVQLVGTDGLPRRHPSEPTLTVEKDQGVEVATPVRDQDDLSIFRFEVSSKLPWPDGTRVRAKVGSTYVGQAPNDGVTIIFEPGTDAAKSSIARVAGETGQLRAGLDAAKLIVTARNALDDDRQGGGDLVVPTVTPAGAPVDVVVADRHDGTYEFTVTATGSADVTVGATIDGRAVGGTKPVLAFRTPGAGAQSVISTSANPVDAGSSNATITVAVKDDGGRNRNLGGDEVELWTERGGSVAATQLVTASGSNTVQTTFTAPTQAGDVEIHGTVNGESLTPLVLTVRGGVAVAANSTLSAAPDKVVADGVDYALITATLKDTYGNDAKTACTTTNLSFHRTGSGSFSERSASANVCTIRLRATTAGTVVVKALYNSAQLANSSTVTFEKPADADTTTITASHPTRPADGTSESVITVQAVSEDGVVRTFGGDVVTLSTDLGTFGNGSGTVQAVDNSDGTYTAELISTSAGTANVSGVINGAAIIDAATVIFEATAPDAPTSVTATEDDSSTDVSWTAPMSTGGVPLSHYVVSATPDTGDSVSATVDASATQHPLSGLLNGVAYDVTVQAVNEADEVSPATEASKQVVPFGDPQAPVPTIDRTSGAITLAWDPVDGNGRPISGYAVTAAPAADGDAVTQQATLEADDDGKIRHTFDALTKGAEYDFTIVARNEGGKESVPSDKLPQRFAAKPAAPPQPAVTAGNGKVTLSWTAPDNGGEPISTYHVTATPAGGTAITKETGHAGTTLEVVDLTNGTAYDFTVTATNVLGTSLESEKATATPVAPSAGGGGGIAPSPSPTPTVSPTPSPTPSPTSAPGPLPGPGPVRINGEDRASTAAAVSASHFEPGVSVVYVATAANYADALAGGPAAAHGGGPVLLVDRDRVPESTSFELQRLDPERVVLLGGTGAVSELVAEQLDDVAPVQRLSGTDRFSTAAAVSAATFPERVSVAYIATGNGFADALSGGAAAARDRGPVLLAGNGDLPAATVAELRRLSPRQIVVLGGTGAVSPEVAAELAEYTDGAVERLSGSDRYATSAAIAARMFPVAVDTVFVATGENFPDALAGVPAAAREKAPLLLVRHDAVPQVVAAQLERLRPRRIVILGGNGAVSAETEDQLSRYTVE